MRKSTTDTMNDYDVYDAVVMGVLEPILVLSVMAVIAALLRLLEHRDPPSQSWAAHPCEHLAVGL